MKALKRKLFLSIASLAVCAATLVSTTFAWYTSNTEVSASNVTGTSQANGEGLLLISKTGADGTFTNSVDLGINTTSLVPVEYTSGALSEPTIKGWNSGTASSGDELDVTGNTSTGAYIKIELWFRGVQNSTGVSVNLKQLTLTNTTGTLPAKDVLTTTGLGESWNISTDKTYKVDILRNIMIGYTVEEGVPNEGGTAYKYTMKSVGVIDPENLCTISAEDSFKAKSIDSFDAHSYYEGVTGTEPNGSDPIVDANALEVGDNLSFGTTPASTASYNALKLTLYVFINGWDKACFDAIQGQTFTLNLGFSSESSNINN